MAITGDKKREYQRDYMRRRRALEKAAGPNTVAKAAPARIRELEAEVASLRARIAELEMPTAAPEPIKAEPTLAEQEAAFRVNKAAFDAQMAAEYAVFGRPKSLVIDEIKRLLPLSDDDPLAEPIIAAMLRHVGDQTDIQWGIPRRVYRKVLSDLSPNRAPGNEAAFIRFKAWDATIKEIKEKGPEGEAVVKPNRRSIVIPDNRVKTMADLERKQRERSEKAKAAAAKRKAK